MAFTSRNLCSGLARAKTSTSRTQSQRGAIHILDLAAGDRGFAVADAEHFGDGRGRDLVIAGDHGDADAAAVAFLDGLDGFLARRIEKTDQPEQDKGFWQVDRKS